MDERFYNIYNNTHQLEIKKYGEVYTPECIAINMINKIPEEVWNNKNLKVLDFACGCGIFGYFIYKKLIQYFDHDYIINNILYFNDIQEKNINNVKYIFNNPRNIYHCNFLEWNCNIKFDVIIGNPPYQSHNNKRSNGNAIWHKFVDKLLKLLNENGYLSLIHPPGWRKPATNKCKYTYLYNELTQKRQMIYLEMHSQVDGKLNFKCDIKYDIYLIKNTLPSHKTKITDYNKEIIDIDLMELKFIPNKQIKIIYKLLDCKGNKINVIYSSYTYELRRNYVNDKQDNIYKYPIIHSITKNGLRLIYSSKNNLGHFGISKIIITMLPGTNFICQHYIDIEGKYGMSNNVFAITINNIEEAKKIANSLNTKKFRIFMEALSFHTRALEFRCFYYFNDGIWDEFLKDD